MQTSSSDPAILDLQNQINALKNHKHLGTDSLKINASDLEGGSSGGSSIGGTVYNPTYTQIKSTGPTALVFQNTAFTPVGITWGSNQFTVTTAGLYMVGCVMTCQSSTTSLEQESFYAYVYQNGSAVLQGTAIGTVPAASNTASAIGVISCAVGDIISFYAGAISGVSGVNYFQINTTQSQTYGFITG